MQAVRHVAWAEQLRALVAANPRSDLTAWRPGSDPRQWKGVTVSADGELEEL